nr:PREDICTED: uncharacterized protein LOC105672887 [Linepithema humile]
MEIRTEMVNVLEESAPLKTMICKWALEFQRGLKYRRRSPQWIPPQWSPKSVTTPEIIQQIYDMVLDDRRIKVREIVEAMGTSKERVGYILHEELRMKKLSARCVPHLLRIDEKRNRIQWEKSTN